MDSKRKQRRSSHDERVESICGLVDGLQALNKEALQAYIPIVDSIVRPIFYSYLTVFPKSVEKAQ